MYRYSMRTPHSLEIVKYDYNGKDIVISMIKVLDEKGEYIKFAKLGQNYTILI